MMRLFSRTTLVVTALVFTAQAHAVVDCTGTVTNLSIQLDAYGTVTLGLSSGPAYTYLCLINGDYNGVAAIVCRTMYATLMSAKLSGKRVLIRFYDHATCAAVPNWAPAGSLGWTQLLLD
jgi:hypothetical protein